MREMTQTLESRRLLSVTVPPSLMSTILQLESDGTALKATLQHDVPVVNADIAVINATFHGLPNARQDHLMLSVVHMLEMRAMVVLEGDILKIMHVGSADLGKAIKAVDQASAHPSTATHAAATAAIANLNTGVTAAFNKFGADVAGVGGVISDDVMAITLANSSVPAVQNAVAKMQSDFTGEFAVLHTHFQSLETNFQNLLVGLNGLA